MGRLDGKVAFISGGARGQGRAHALHMAEEGADIITFDLCQQIETVEYPMATREDLAETALLVGKTGRRTVARQADVRDFEAVTAVLDEGVAEFGHVDIVVANAGIMPITGDRGKQRQAFLDATDVMLTGVFNTCEAAIPSMVQRGRGGSIVITSSTAGLKGITPNYEFAVPGLLGYTAAKHGVVGLMRAYANALAAHSIRCNTVHPSGVNSPMVVNEAFAGYAAQHPEIGRLGNPMPVELLDVGDIARAVVFLCSTDGQYITGITLPVDGGFCNK
jgi:SDR family mycofactocin-dependent oxidoreductase